MFLNLLIYAQHCLLKALRNCILAHSFRDFVGNNHHRFRCWKTGPHHTNLFNQLVFAHHTFDWHWRDAENLEQAQQHKLELVARKLGLQAGMRILDIGCGWGGSAKYMAEHHDVEVVGITLSQEQHKLANE